MSKGLLWKRLRSLLISLVIAGAVVSVACAQQTPTTGSTTAPGAQATSATTSAVPRGNVAYIANVQDPTITVLDLDKLTVVDSIVFRPLKGKQQGHFLSVSPDGKYIWIAEDISPNGGFVQVLDSAMGRQVQRWDVGAGVANYTSRDGKYLFTSSTKTNNINVFDVANQKYLGDFPIGAAPHVIDTSPDGRVLWTTDSAGGNLRSFDISGLPSRLPTALDTIKIGGTLHAVLVHPNGKYVFVGSADSGDNVVDIATKSIITKVPGKPHNYDISPDRKYLLSGESEFATCDELKELGPALGGSKGPLLRRVNIAALDAAGTPDLKTVKTEDFLDAGGRGPASVSHNKYDPTGKYVLVTTYQHKDASPNGEGELLIVNAASLKIELVLPMPTKPHGIAISGHNR